MSLERLDVSTCNSLEKVTNLPNLLRSLDLWICGFDKVVEVQGLFKLEPIGNYGAEMINKLGLSNLESKGNVEADLFNNMTLANRKLPLQGLYGFGILSMFLPGSKVPGGFWKKSTGSSMCFNVPCSLANLKIQGLNICVVYYSKAGFNKADVIWNEFFIKISNKSKDLKWTYSPTVIGIPEDDKGMMWLSNWKIGNQFEGGDEVNVSVFFRARFQQKEIGIHIVYEEEEEEEERGSQNTTTCASSQNVIDDGGLSAYQVATGSYFFCHYYFEVHQECNTDDDWKSCYEFLFGDSIDTLCQYFTDVSSPS